MSNTNEFIYLFDLLDFDADGNVCATSFVDLKHAQSNFLYLVAKYNQMILKEQNLKLSSFFIEDLADLLIDLETEEKSFSEVKTIVLKHCTKQVQTLADGSEKKLFVGLCEKVSLKTLATADKNAGKFLENFQTVTNKLEKGNKLTREFGKRFSNVILLIAALRKDGNLSKEDKSQLYKDVIAVNRFSREAEKVSGVEKVERNIG